MAIVDYSSSCIIMHVSQPLFTNSIKASSIKRCCLNRDAFVTLITCNTLQRLKIQVTFYKLRSFTWIKPSFHHYECVNVDISFLLVRAIICWSIYSTVYYIVWCSAVCILFKHICHFISELCETII